MTFIYGINNCDTVKKSLTWLKKQDIEFTFHDFKKQGLSGELLNEMLKESDWSTLLNKRSTSYRNLPDTLKNNLTDEAIFAAVLAQPTLLKRPVLIHNNQLHVGFKEQQYQEVFLR